MYGLLQVDIYSSVVLRDGGIVGGGDALYCGSFQLCCITDAIGS